MIGAQPMKSTDVIDAIAYELARVQVALNSDQAPVPASSVLWDLAARLGIQSQVRVSRINAHRKWILEQMDKQERQI